MVFTAQRIDASSGGYLDMSANLTMDRREFLGATGVLTGLLAAGSPLALLAPSRAWALDLKSLTSAEGAALLTVARTIAPHDKLDDAATRSSCRRSTRSAARDAATLALLRQGVARARCELRLPPARPSASRPEGRSRPTPFFKVVRATTLRRCTPRRSRTPTSATRARPSPRAVT